DRNVTGVQTCALPILDSKMKKKDREKIVEDFRSGRYKYLLATYSLIAEGFDVPMLENIVMASPIKDERLVIQSIGRCQRPYKDRSEERRVGKECRYRR